MKASKGQKVPEKGPEDFQARLGAAIRAQRKRLGVTQEELAWRADMHRTYLADIERGGRNITLRSMVNLARALQVSAEHLLSHSRTAMQGDRPMPELGEVLLVEDSKDDAELALRAFKRARFTNPIKVVRGGNEALDYLHCAGRYQKRRTGLPQLVLLDLNLPDIPGTEVLSKIKSHKLTRQIPVVVLTVSRDDQTILECSRMGAENYLIKPVGFDSFTRVTPKLNLQWALLRPRTPGAVSSTGPR